MTLVILSATFLVIVATSCVIVATFLPIVATSCVIIATFVVIVATIQFPPNSKHFSKQKEASRTSERLPN